MAQLLLRRRRLLLRNLRERRSRVRTRRLVAPLGTGWTVDARSLVSLRVHILGRWCGRLVLYAGALSAAQ